MKNSTKIRAGTIKEAVAVSDLIPELINPHRASEYQKRMSGKKQIILIAEVNEELAGFKVGYDKFENGSDFYTWMGGVLPKFRQCGIADTLAKKQEAWATTNGFKNIILKTRNRHRGMLIFAIKNGFEIIDLDMRDSVAEHRILLKKKIKKCPIKKH